MGYNSYQRLETCWYWLLLVYVACGEVYETDFRQLQATVLGALDVPLSLFHTILRSQQ
jgi:hypothetical protein